MSFLHIRTLDADVRSLRNSKHLECSLFVDVLTLADVSFVSTPWPVAVGDSPPPKNYELISKDSDA